MKAQIFLTVIVVTSLSFSPNKVKLLMNINQSDTSVFTRLKSALKQPNLVYKLNLSGQSLKKFPKEILMFRNLFELNIGVKEIYKKKGKAASKKYPPNHISSFDWLFYKIKVNEIYLIPDEIGQLDKLRLLNITGNKISNENMARLNALLPNCQIVY